jgi:hypothetical protein
MRAIGYHGTSVERAERILASGFQASHNEYDWLGDGAYFFQDAPGRAWEWARERFGGEAAVVGAEIDLDGCMDLLDSSWHGVLRDAHADLRARLRKLGYPEPRQTRGAHRLDREVVNHAAKRLERGGIPVRSVRAAFAEGEPLFPGSALYSRSHIQITVRDSSAIQRLWRVAAEGRTS